MSSQIINLKKSSAIHIVSALFLIFSLFTACGPKKLYNTEVKGKQIPIKDDYADDTEIENFIAPYRNRINNDLDSTIAWSPITFTKRRGKWQTNIGNLMADMTFEKADKLFYMREKKHIDICLLNHGGIRATIPQGKVTARTAYEVMPFENSLIIMELKGEQLWDIAVYIANERKPHPLAGMSIMMDENDSVKKVLVQGIPVDNSKTYYIATSDYLANGGDNMDFFKMAVNKYKTDYKLRNLYIDYFRDVDTLPINPTERIIIEQ